jgi:hypothetical protein
MIFRFAVSRYHDTQQEQAASAGIEHAETLSEHCAAQHGDAA